MAEGPVEVSLYTLPLPAFKEAIHQRIGRALPGPAFAISPGEQAEFASALQNLHDYFKANGHGFVRRPSLGTREGFTWNGSIAERRFIAALPMLEDSSPSGHTPKKVASMPSVLSAPANMERMVDQTIPPAAFNLDFLPSSGGPSPPTSAGSSPLHPLSQAASVSQPSLLRPPRPGPPITASELLNPFNESSPKARDDSNPFESPTSAPAGPNPFDTPPGENPFDTPPREPSAALQPILDKIPDLSFMLSDKMVEPAKAAQAASEPFSKVSQARSSMDEWGDFSGQPATTGDTIAEAPAAVVAPKTENNEGGNFESQPSDNPGTAAADRSTAVLQPRASLDDWGDFNG